MVKYLISFSFRNRWFVLLFSIGLFIKCTIRSMPSRCSACGRTTSENRQIGAIDAPAALPACQPVPSRRRSSISFAYFMKLFMQPMEICTRPGRPSRNPRRSR